MPTPCFSLIIAVVSLGFSCLSFYIAQQTKRQYFQISLFVEYTRRYQDIELHLINNNSIDKNYIKLYFDLCSEEFYLNQCDCLPEEVWNMWLDGMRIVTKNKAFHEMWKTNSQFYNDDFVGFFTYNVLRFNEKNS